MKALEKALVAFGALWVLLNDHYLRRLFQAYYNAITPGHTHFSDSKAADATAWQRYYGERFVKQIRKALRQCVRQGLPLAPRFDQWSSRAALYAPTGIHATRLRAQAAAWAAQGVEWVRWVAHLDDRTCATCRMRHGRLYVPLRIPTVPHPHCRCHLEPIPKGALP